MDYQEMLVELQKRRKLINQDHKAGLSYTQLSRKYNLSVSRIGQICVKEKKHEDISSKK